MEKVTKLRLQRILSKVTGLSLDEIKTWEFKREKETGYSMMSGSYWSVEAHFIAPNGIIFPTEWNNGSDKSELEKMFEDEFKEVIENIKDNIKDNDLKIDELSQSNVKLRKSLELFKLEAQDENK